MDRSESEILRAIRDLAVEQAILREKVETQLKIHTEVSHRLEEIDKEAQENYKLIHKHDIFIKVSLWAYTFILSGLGVSSLVKWVRLS